jgi:hypothetical protein
MKLLITSTTGVSGQAFRLKHSSSGSAFVKQSFINGKNDTERPTITTEKYPVIGGLQMMKNGRFLTTKISFHSKAIVAWRL